MALGRLFPPPLQTFVNRVSVTAHRNTRRGVYGVLIIVPGARPCSVTAALTSARVVAGQGGTGWLRLAFFAESDCQLC